VVAKVPIQLLLLVYNLQAMGIQMAQHILHKQYNPVFLVAAVSCDRLLLLLVLLRVQFLAIP
jgi:hypothetical protein